jgi:hypothetical protein|tara:strand:- start:436 stop:615 length:180 start_codon:yes stop_codon:yes gene_type:complete
MVDNPVLVLVIAMVANMAMRTITTISSIRENPLEVLLVMFLINLFMVKIPFRPEEYDFI